MHPDLETLLQIQDLRSQRQLLTEEHGESVLQREEFNIDLDKAIETLDEKIRAMEEDLSPSISARYRRIASGGGRVVAPVIDGTCYACFVSIPTAHGAGAESNRAIRHCENCGRFLYVLG